MLFSSTLCLSSVLITQMRNCPRLLRVALFIAECLLQNWTCFTIFLVYEREKWIFSESFLSGRVSRSIFSLGFPLASDVNSFWTLQPRRGNWRELSNQPLIKAEVEREPLLLSQQIFRPKFPFERWLSRTLSRTASRDVFIAFCYLRFEEKFWSSSSLVCGESARSAVCSQ